MIHRTTICLSLFVAFIATAVASPAAAVFEPLNDGRSIHAEFFDPYFSDVRDATPPVPFAPWIDQVYAGGAYLADQSSEAVTATRMAASGSADGFSEYGLARSTFSITFEVSVPTPYTLAGSLSENPVAFNEARFQLSGGSGAIFSAGASANTILFSHSGVLAPGQYEVLAEAYWHDNLESRPPGVASFDFELLAIPEPGTGLLVGSGLLLLAHRAARARRRA